MVLTARAVRYDEDMQKAFPSGKLKVDKRLSVFRLPILIDTKDWLKYVV
jgi:hypothetical protein